MLKIINNIKKKKIPLDDYINTCLYKYKSSYYEKKKYLDPEVTLLHHHIFQVYLEKL